MKCWIDRILTGFCTRHDALDKVADLDMTHLGIPDWLRHDDLDMPNLDQTYLSIDDQLRYDEHRL